MISDPVPVPSTASTGRRLGRLAIVERTHKTGILWRNLGPPVIDEKELVSGVQQGGFKFAGTVPYGNSSIVFAQKVVPSH